VQQVYDKHQVQSIGKTGSTIAYLPKGMLHEGLVKLPGLGKQTLDHYSSVIQLARLSSRL